ncbi:MAG TPA: hypothetical protein PLO51_03455 [Candidatus Micrarchaeota archaeon]|nr:hypothetical protein [Candidatus Micrarchaeota archaeon]
MAAKKSGRILDKDFEDKIKKAIAREGNKILHPKNKKGVRENILDKDFEEKFTKGGRILDRGFEKRAARAVAKAGNRILHPKKKGGNKPGRKSGRKK